MTGRGYAWRCALAVVLFLALTLGFRLIVWALLTRFGSQPVPSDSGILLLLAMLFLKPLIILAFMIFLVWVSSKRLRTLGEWRIAAVTLPLLILVDAILFAAMRGSSWMAFALGIGFVAPPYASGIAILLMILFAVSRPAAEREAALVLLHRAMLVAVALLIILGLLTFWAYFYIPSAALRGGRQGAGQPEAVQDMTMWLWTYARRSINTAWLVPLTASLVLLRIASELVMRFRKRKPT